MKMVKQDRTMQNVTKTEYGSFQHAYDFFNRELFNNELPAVMITLQRHAKTRGYFAPSRFIGRTDETNVHEMALNPDNFIGRTDREILSTLVHEQAHVWQHENNSSPRRGYHDKEWGAKMKEIGLYPSNTGAEGGKETGQQMTHYIMDDGKYAAAFLKLQEKGFKLLWQSPAMSKAAKKAARSSKTKYTCHECGQNAWAKPAAMLICGECETLMVVA